MRLIVFYKPQGNCMFEINMKYYVNILNMLKVNNKAMEITSVDVVVKYL